MNRVPVSAWSISMRNRIPCSQLKTSDYILRVRGHSSDRQILSVIATYSTVYM
jgi:hypothetical protein